MKRLLPLLFIAGCGPGEPPAPTVRSLAAEVRMLENQIRRDAMHVAQLRRMRARPAVLRRWSAILRNEQERYREAKDQLIQLDLEAREEALHVPSLLP